MTSSRRKLTKLHQISLRGLQAGVRRAIYYPTAMDLPEMIEACLALPEVEETTPFGPETLVYKVAGKMFAATDPQRVPIGVNLKCDPDRALDLRDQFPAIQPGWHMNKRHWNTIELNGSLPDTLLLELVEHSYRLVVAGLKKAERSRIEAIIDPS